MKIVILLVLACSAAIASAEQDAAKEQIFSNGGGSAVNVILPDQPQTGGASIRTADNDACPCKCTKKRGARSQCKPLSSTCEVSRCNFPTGKKGFHCCAKDQGRCDCNRKGFLALGWAYGPDGSQARATSCVRDACALNKKCPPNCLCGKCPVTKLTCSNINLPGVENFWVCRADCTATKVTTCEAIPGRR